jgi:hypothetical protein
MADKHMKKCSSSLAISEMQIQTTLRCHLTPVLERLFSNKTTTNVGRYMGGNGLLFIVGGNVN